jgi:hypothetical protein
MSTQAYIRKTIDLYISDSFRDLLEQFKDESQVASLLLHKRLAKEDVVDDNVNFISISDSDKTKISYLTEDRIEKISQSATDDYWTTSKRFHCKPGAFVTKLFKGISQKEIEKFSNLYKSFSDKKDFVMKVVSGQDIAKYYDQETYSSNSGTLGNSCMKYSRCQRFFKIYTENPDVISMLVMKSPTGSLIGRALIWNIDGQKVMDRIYTIQDDEYAVFFKQWALKNDCIFKTHQNWNHTLQFDSKTDTQEYKLAVKLKNFNLEYYPYLDTFKWINLNDGTIANYKVSEDFSVISNADGQSQPHYMLEFDDISRDWQWRGNLMYLEDLNIRTNGNNLNHSETLGKWLLKSESYYDEELRDFFYTDSSKNDEKLVSDRREIIKRINDEEKKFREDVVNVIDAESSSLYEILRSNMWMRGQR